MITERGKVVAVETDGIWVETANQSACSRCSARKGCGQSLLAQVDGHRSYIKAALNGHNTEDFRDGDLVTIGVHETAVIRGSLIVYCLPLMGLIGGATLGNTVSLSEPGVVALAATGLTLAALGVRWFSRFYSDDERFQPVVVSQSPKIPMEAGIIQHSPVSVSLNN